MPETKHHHRNRYCPEGADFIDIKLQIFDRDLPSLEWRNTGTSRPIGEALVEMTESGHGQSIGHFQNYVYAGSIPRR